jgi:hypothetical protein
MSRRIVVTALTGAIVMVGLGAPALAGPELPESEPTVVCLRLDDENGERDGVCVWVPVGR